MEEFLASLDINQYLPAALAWATNILLALAILIIGLWIASKVYNAIAAIASSHPQLDDTLFKFFGSVARYTILAFVGIAVLNRFGVQTASIIALLGAAGLAAASFLAAGLAAAFFAPEVTILSMTISDKCCLCPFFTL